MGFVRCMGYSDGDLEASKTVTSNGIVLPTSGYVGMKQVEVNVPTETLTVTNNGVYTPSGNNIGFSSVTVNVSGGIGTNLTKLTVAGSDTQAVNSDDISFPNGGRILIESYLSGIYQTNGQISIRIMERGEIGQPDIELYSITPYIIPHIGYSQGDGNDGYIPIISIPTNSTIYMQCRMLDFVSNIVTTFLIYY